METVIEYAALGIGAAGFGLIVWVSLRAWPDRSSRQRGERFIPGNYHAHAYHGDGGTVDDSQN